MKQNQREYSVSNTEGKVQPNSVEIEAIVLGQILIEKNAIDDVVSILKKDSFYKDAHQNIYDSILHLYSKNEPINMFTVTEILKSRNQLNETLTSDYVKSLTNTYSVENIIYNADIIRNYYKKRVLGTLGAKINEMAFDNTVSADVLSNEAESGLFVIQSDSVAREPKKIGGLISRSLKVIENNGLRGDGLTGITTGFNSLDMITFGWQKSDLIILAARPSMGKTAFSLSVARNIAVNKNIPIAIFSLEMSELQLVNRLISSETNIPSGKLSRGKFEIPEWQEIDKKIRPLEEAPIYIDDTPSLSIFELRSKARKLRVKNGIELIIVDYLQLMTAPDNKSREQEVSTISRSLKALAKELDIPVIALSQLNRSVEMRGGDKRPQLSDLRESGAIEQDADIVMFIHRPEKFGILEDADGNSTKGIAEIIIAKHRNGAVTDVKLRFESELAKFSDLDVSEGDSFFPQKVEANTGFETETVEAPF